METFFKVGNLLAMPFWVLMIVLPRWRWTVRVMRSPLVAAGPALLYVILVVPRLAEVVPVLIRPELHAVAGLLGTAGNAAAAWMHFLAFDLLVGRWVYMDGLERRVSPWATAPILFLTLLLGPLGFLLYLPARHFLGRPDSVGSAPVPPFA